MEEYHGGQFTKPYILPPQLGSKKYLVFLQEVPSEVLIVVPSTNFAHHVVSSGRGWHLIIENVYVIIGTEHCQIGGLGMAASQIHGLFFLGAVKDIVYYTPLNSTTDLVKRISRIAAGIVFSNMSINACRVDVVLAYIPMVAISNTSCDVFIAYFLLIIFYN